MDSPSQPTCGIWADAVRLYEKTRACSPLEGAAALEFSSRVTQGVCHRRLFLALESPLTVEVMDATVTLVIALRATSRVSTRTGRVLSSFARQISRTSVLERGAVRGPLHEGVEIILRAFRIHDCGVHKRRLPPFLTFESDAPIRRQHSAYMRLRRPFSALVACPCGLASSTKRSTCSAVR